mmetsp:Transcript_59456/g.140576  ORF Transcript_59456/g.140576 Transcript_59456/m.140576 type:complete len:1566 (-) Transcript_59456:75-4772(-)
MVKRGRRWGAAVLLLVGVWAQISGCSDESDAAKEDAGEAAARADAENGRLLLIGGERIDTAAQHGVAPVEWRRRSDKPRGPVWQYYAQLEEGADMQEVSQKAGVGAFGDYVPNNAFIVLTDLAGAQHLASQPGVAWVGRRPARHKTATDLLAPGPRRRRRTGGQEPAKASALGAQKLLVLLVPRIQRCAESAPWVSSHPRHIEIAPCALEVVGVPGDATAAAAAWQGVFEEEGLSASATPVGESLVSVRVGEHDDVRSVAEFLTDRAEVAYVERAGRYKPLTNAATRLISDGDALEVLMQEQTTMRRNGLDGSGQIAGMADTGLDWDSCFFWEADGSPTFPNRGKPPPFESVDVTRRKIVAYQRYEDCAVCNKCPEDVEEDVQKFASSNGLIESGKDRRFLFPKDPTLSALPPRVYDSAGASVRYTLTANTAETQSQYLAQGAGAFDFPTNIQLFIVPAADLLTFDVDDKASWAKCLNPDCADEATTLEATRLALASAVDGFGVIIANRGAGETIGDVKPHIWIKGEIQFMTALKPCGDLGDDKQGHGTHVAGAMLGSALTPLALAAEQEAAGKFNGVAPGAKLFFLDSQQNADPNCNIPGKPCNRVNDIRIPEDLKGLLFDAPYAAGVRVHLNSWGCEFVDGSRPSSCNTYSIKSRDVDKFMYEKGDLLIVFAAGERGLLEAEGTLAEPATCKNCLTVGASETWNEHYREMTRHRDAMEDLCKCEFPSFCTRSSIVAGEAVTSPAKRTAALLPLLEATPCCNDTTHEFLALKDTVISAGQVYTVHFPDLAVTADDLMSYVLSKFQWGSKGSSVHYSFSAEEEGFTSVSSTTQKPDIQVMVLPRKFFIQYFEDGHSYCADANIDGCRPNPCTSDLSGNDFTCLSFLADPDFEFKTLRGLCAPASLGPGKPTAPDSMCHKGGCEINVNPESEGGPEWLEGCPSGTQCCNDAFLTTHCVNKPCDVAGSTVEGIFRHNDGIIDNSAVFGYGLVIRNVGDRAIKVSGSVEFHNREYPCTLLDCCDAVPPADCCATKYKRPFGTANSCAQCELREPLATCIPSEINNHPASSSRGPALNSYDPEAITRVKRIKPELTAPGTWVISANSDGAIPSTGPPDEYQVMCGKATATTVDAKTGCTILTSGFYSNKTAASVGGGTSVSAALVAGAALLVRQYLADGYYPQGSANASNARFDNPSAALVKAMLVSCASPVSGNTVKKTYKYEPYCDSTVTACPDWVAPPPVVSTPSVAGAPNYFQGFGRPVLKDVLYFTDSTFSLVLVENAIPEPGLMHTYTFPILGTSETQPLRATMAWTDPPGAPGAENVLVNNLDLLVQLSAVQTIFEPNLGISITRQVMTRFWGNGGATRDMANPIEHVQISMDNTETNVTVVVTAINMPVKKPGVGQAYALVISGNLRPRYHLWMATTRSALLARVGATGPPEADDEATVQGFNYVDLFKRGAISPTDLALQFPGMSEGRARNLVTEADLDKDGSLQLDEWIELVMAMRKGTRVPADPVFLEDLIDPSILAGQTIVGNATFSAAPRTAPRTAAHSGGVLLLSLLAVCASLRR